MRQTNSDEFGFIAAALSGMNIFEHSMRRTGRTLRMIERVQPGDQIVVPDLKTGRNIEMLLREKGKSGIKVIVAPVNDVPLRRVGTAQGRTFFEHTWVQQWVQRQIEQAAGELEHWQKAMSKTWPDAPPERDHGADRMIDYADMMPKR